MNTERVALERVMPPTAEVNMFSIPSQINEAAA